MLAPSIGTYRRCLVRHAAYLHLPNLAKFDHPRLVVADVQGLKQLQEFVRLRQKQTRSWSIWIESVAETRLLCWVGWLDKEHDEYRKLVAYCSLSRGPFTF